MILMNSNLVSLNQLDPWNVERSFGNPANNCRTNGKSFVTYARDGPRGHLWQMQVLYTPVFDTFIRMLMKVEDELQC